MKLFPLLQHPQHKIYVVNNTVVSKLQNGNITNYSIIDGCSCNYFKLNNKCKHIEIYRGEYRPLNTILINREKIFLFRLLTAMNKSGIIAAPKTSDFPRHDLLIKIKSKIELPYKHFYYVSRSFVIYVT